MENEFVTVTYKNKKHGKKSNQPKFIQEYFEKADICNPTQCRKKIDEYIIELQQSAFWRNFLNTLYHSIECTESPCHKVEENVLLKNHHFKEAVLYGIGSIANSHIAKYQLAFCYLLMNELKITCHFHDPILSEQERQMIKSYGFTEIHENEECKKMASKQTVFVMFHCGKSMYNNLLWKNWNRKQLENLCIIGNSFENYLQRTPSRLLEESAQYLSQIIPYTTEHKIENCFTHEDIFNDSSIHTFTRIMMSKIPEATMQLHEEPAQNNDDVEIICKKT